MFLKRFAAVIAAALTVAVSAPAVYAEYDYDYGYDYNYDYNNYDYNDYNYNYDYNYDTGYDTGNDNGYGETTTTAPTPEYDPAQTAGNEVTSMDNKTTTLVPDKPTSAPSRVYLKPGEIKDGKVSVELRIEADSAVSDALMSVTFDTSLLQLTSTEINQEAGGVAAENSFNGKYVFNYTNDSGSKFQGNYVTLNFDVLDQNLVSTTLFLTVTTLDNKTGVPISYSVDNGIIGDPNASGAQGETETKKYNKVVTVQKSIGQASPADMGIVDYRNIVVADPTIVSFEDGVFKMLAAGETSFDVVFNNDELETYDIVVVDDTLVTDAQDRTAPAAEEKSTGFDKTVRNLLIIIAVALTMVIIAVEYLIIMKPTSKRRRKLAVAEAFFEREEQMEDDNDEEMRADLKKAFAARDARRKAARGDEPDDEAIEDEAPKNEDADAETHSEEENGGEE